MKWDENTLNQTAMSSKTTTLIYVYKLHVVVGYMERKEKKMGKKEGNKNTARW